MSSTLLRSGLWVIILVLGAWVLHESYEGLPASEFFAPAMLQKGLVFGGMLLVAGVVARMFEGTAKAIIKPRCAVCRTPVTKGAIYCRAHLRAVLHNEDDRLHATRVRRTK